ncbi:hypothetical protein EW027_17005 [Aeribacillus pallidus]|uniref:hypothetical protein n=1 Tax=Aeribacillus pallidus TaxID=33936 RepID=UPI001022E659|nr:hypothetical protein [Aeribacillus pallidus]RZI50156.1 hypothetical protein EW027_17005 [Aeribacillus pallidus]
MSKESVSALGYILISIVLIISIYLLIEPNSLVPEAYKLAVDGYVIARTLVILFILYLVSKLGFLFINKKINFKL